MARVAKRVLFELIALSDALWGVVSKPHIISILQDDLGFYDSGIHNPEAASWTANITSLARGGIVLERHYTHWHCSPTRRSFLTGRLPIHHGEQLSSNGADDIDLRITWVSQKLKSRGYRTHWFGKMHTGFRSWQHLGMNKGFDTNVGSLQTGGSYSGSGHKTRWQDGHPIWEDSQFTGKPAQCGTVETSAPPQGCSMPLMNATKMACGHGYRFVEVDTAGECCHQCEDDDDCTHWVHNPRDTKRAACHLKRGKNNCSTTKAGATSGSKSPPSPSPAPAPGGAECTNEYSTDLWGMLAVQAVHDHDPEDPLYLHLCFQAVHKPYNKAPGDPTGDKYRGMLWRADVYIGELVAALKARGMWEKTLLVYAADNGGTAAGNNHPLRGEKHSNWEGAMRVAAFVSGGLVPQHLRGTSSSVITHIVDWYPTFAALAGADPSDDPPVAPLPADVSNPQRNIYGDDSFPPVDGVDVWPILTQPERHAEPDSAHKHLILSKEVLLAGKYKLLVSQPHFKSQNSGWKQPDGTWAKSNDDPCAGQDVGPGESALPVPQPGRTPCLYDLEADPGEHENIAQDNPGIVADLWAALNRSIAGMRDCNGWSGPVKGPAGSCSPASLLGTCDTPCAEKKWKAYGNKDGPICGVPGCNGLALV